MTRLLAPMVKKPEGAMTPKEKRIHDAVAYLTRYMESYPEQREYLKYSEVTYINDVLYGLGVSLSKKYKFADGFRQFRERLLKHLQEDKG